MGGRHRAMSDRSGALLGANRDIWEGYAVPTSEPRVPKVVKLLSPEEPGRLLDIGCADGYFGQYFGRFGWNSFGIDISLINVSVSSQRGVKAVVGDLECGLPFGTGSFEAVVAMEIIEHFVDTRLFLSECRRVLAQNGCLILTTPNLARLENRVRLLFGLYPHWMDYELEGGAGHVRCYTLPVLKRQLTEVGFRVEVTTGTTLGFPLLGRIPYIAEGRSRWLKFLGGILPSLAANLVIKVRKV